MYPFAQSMIVSALTASEGNHVTSIVHCDAVPTSYLGMDFDPETLLYIEGGRPYDPAAGRYLTAGSMASGTYNIYAFANNTPVDRSVRDVRGAGMQGIVGGSPIGAGTEAFFGSIGGSLSRIGNGVAQPFLNYYDFGRTLIDAGAELVGYHWNHESVSNMGQAAESGTTMLQLEMALLEGLGTNVADTVTLGGYATYQYRNGDINDSEYGDRMIGMGLSLLGGVGTLRAAGLGSVTVGQATQVALRTAQTTARAAGRALSQIELNPAALTQFNNGIPLNLLRWKQTGNPLAKIAEGFGTAAERAAPVSGGALAEGASTSIRIEGSRVYALMPSNGGTGPNRWMRMNGGGSGNTTRLGVPRDNPGAWRNMRDLWDQTDHGGILSPANRTRILDGRTPHVDDDWIRWFPGDAHLKGELIPMHHIQGTPIVVPLPASRHMDAHMPGGFRFNPGGPGTSG